MELFRLDGQVAFVAGSGIGQGIAVGFVEGGADVGCFDLADSKGLLETIERINARGREGIGVTGDV